MCVCVVSQPRSDVKMCTTVFEGSEDGCFVLLWWWSQGDNSRDRALEDMMRGAITVKREDILKKVGLRWTQTRPVTGVLTLAFYLVFSVLSFVFYLTFDSLVEPRNKLSTIQMIFRK